jgi:hypothetical protein
VTGRAGGVRGAGCRRGFALATALLAIVIVGALVACTAFVAMEEYRVAQGLLLETRAFAAAELGVNSAVTRWGAGDTGGEPPPGEIGGAVTYIVAATSGDQAVVRVMRVADSTVWVVSEGSAGEGTRLRATRRTNLVLRIGTDGALRPVPERSWAQLF